MSNTFLLDERLQTIFKSYKKALLHNMQCWILDWRATANCSLSILNPLLLTNVTIITIIIIIFITIIIIFIAYHTSYLLILWLHIKCEVAQIENPASSTFFQ